MGRNAIPKSDLKSDYGSLSAWVSDLLDLPDDWGVKVKDGGMYGNLDFIVTDADGEKVTKMSGYSGTTAFSVNISNRHREAVADLTDDQAAVRAALIETRADEATATVTEGQEAVHIEVGDASAYFAAYEVRSLSMDVAAAYDGLPAPIKRFLNHALICGEVVAGETTREAALAEADADSVQTPE